MKKGPRDKRKGPRDQGAKGPSGSSRRLRTAAEHSVPRSLGPLIPRTTRSAEGAAAGPGPVVVPAFLPVPYQRRLAEDPGRFIIRLWARQTGKSTACALKVNLDILDTEAAGKKTLWVLLSRGERQSRELAGKVRELGRLISEARKLLGGGPELVELEGSQLEIRYPGGSRAIALPANPDTARGFSGNVVLDEFAFHADSDAIWTALYPTITRGYQIIVVSTANGQQNRFYQLWTEAQERAALWSAEKITIHDAIEQGLSLDIEELKRGIRDETAWQQEYLCEFVDEATAWLPWDLLRAAEDGRASQDVMAPEQMSGAVYAGWDVARWHDLSVLWTVERVGDVLWTRDVMVMRKTRFDDQLTAVRTALERYPKFVRLCVDATGIGEMPAEQAQARLGRYRVEPVKFTAGVKELLAGDLRRMLEDRRLRLPVSESTRADLHSVRRTVTAAGNARFEGEAAGSHADRFWAASLAVHAAGRSKGGQIWFA